MQFLKAPTPRPYTVSGILTPLRIESFSKAEGPITNKFLPKSRFLKELQFEKLLSEVLVILAGKVTLSREVHSEKP